MHQALFAFAACLLPTVRDVYRKRQGNVLLLILQVFTMYTEVFAQLVGRIDQRRGEDRKAKLSRDSERVGAVGGDTYRRVRLLERPGRREGPAPESAFPGMSDVHPS